MRLIDSEILFEKVGNIKPNNKSEYKLLGKFMNIITNSATVERPQWIPCSERLPDKNGSYLITWHSPRGKDHICEKTFLNGSWNSSLNKYITAWMPFPEPYKGGEAE